MHFRAAIFLAMVFSQGVSAQLDEIVVTGSRIENYGMPSVTVTKQADFLVQRIRLINDSRSPELRRQEILETIEQFLKATAHYPGMALSYGTGFLEPIDLSRNSLQMIEDDKRPDTSYVDVYAKVAFNPKRKANDQIIELRRFIIETKKVGRTEVDPLGDIGISVVGPEQHRYEIIDRIAAENRRLGEALGTDCRVSTEGLAGRVEWQRSDISEVTLYIPYSITVANCRP